MVELAKALTLEESVERQLIILLDEPTSVLAAADIEVLFERVRSLKARASFVFVSHRLDEVLKISDRVYTMKDGQVVAEHKAAEVTAPELHHVMVGRGLQAEYYRESRQATPGEQIVVEARGLGLTGAYEKIDLAIRAGEIVGIAGVVGSGREELIRTIGGYIPQSKGTLKVAGETVRFSSPEQAVKKGIGSVPRERRVEGLVMFLSIAENITLADLGSVMRHGVIDYRKERAMASDWIRRLRIKAPGPDVACRKLSGGNQQKVVLARWMTAGSRVLILDHPTRGLDVGAKEEVYDLIRDLSAKGVAILLISDTLEETIGLSHKVLVMRDGEVTARYDASPSDKPDQVDLVETWCEAAMDSPFSLKSFLDAGWMHAAIPPALLVGLVAIIELAVPGFLTGETLSLLFANTAVLFILATGVTFVILLGGIDLSIQAVASLASVILAQLLPGYGLLAFPIAILSGLVFGLLSGVVHVRLRVPSFVATLATAGIVTGMALWVSDGRAITIEEGGRLNTAWVNATVAGIPVVVLLAAAVGVASFLALRYTRFGRQSLAVGAGEPAAWAAGINVDRTKIIAFAVSGMLAAIAGVILASRLSSGSPSLANRAAAAGHRRRHRRRHGDHRRAGRRGAHRCRRADHLAGAHRHDLRWRQHLRREHRLRRGADHCGGHHYRPIQDRGDQVRDASGRDPKTAMRLTHSLHRVQSDQLDLVAVGVLDEGDVGGAVLHRPGLTRDFGAALFQFGAYRVDVVDAERQVTEAGADIVGLLAPPVERQFDHGMRLFRAVTDEGIGELAAGIFVTSQQFHAEHLGVESDRSVKVEHPDHGVHVAEFLSDCAHCNCPPIFENLVSDCGDQSTGKCDPALDVQNQGCMITLQVRPCPVIFAAWSAYREHRPAASPGAARRTGGRAAGWRAADP